MPSSALIENANVSVILEVHAFQDVGDEEFRFLDGWDLQPSFGALFKNENVVFLDQARTDHFLTYRMIYRGTTNPSITDNRMRVMLTCVLSPGRSSEDEQLLFGCHLSATFIVDVVQASVESAPMLDQSVQVDLDPPSPPFELIG